MAKTLGIDLGTTNSAMALLEGGEPAVIPNAEGGRTTPSVVAFTKDGQRLVGAPARRQQVTNPENTVFSIKRFMGRKWDEVSEEMTIVPYEVVKGPNGDARVKAGGKEYAPPEISAMILQKLKADAEAYLGEPVSDAVVTVPAYFNNAQREATKDAGKIAGLNVVRIINEPTAAALAYGLDKEGSDQTILVFDLGGGTFDVSILELGEGVFEVKATNGDNHLGGDNFDKAVVDWMVGEFKKDQGIDLAADRMALQRLYEAAEKAKIELSSTMTTQINLPFITATQEGPKHLDLQLTRAKLNELTAELLERTVGPTKQALADAGIDKSGIDHVVLVGGMTGIPPAPRGMPLIEVTFDIDANGIIHVSAKDLGTGNEQKIRIEGGSGLKEDEVQRMIKEAEAHSEEAHQLRELADARNVAESLAYQTEKSLKDHRDKLPEADASTIEGRIMELRGVLESSDANEIRQKTEALQEASQKLAEILYSQATAQAQASAPGDGASGATDDEVVEEADYEVIDEEEGAAKP